MEPELKWIVMDVFAPVENGYVLRFHVLILKFQLQLKNIVNMKTWITKLIEIYFNDHKNFVLFSFSTKEKGCVTLSEKSCVLFTKQISRQNIT